MAGAARLELAFAPWDAPRVKVLTTQKMAGAARLELATPGFGDQCSTN